jgi:hypothetical protein
VVFVAIFLAAGGKKNANGEDDQNGGDDKKR